MARNLPYKLVKTTGKYGPVAFTILKGDGSYPGTNDTEFVTYMSKLAKAHGANIKYEGGDLIWYGPQPTMS